MSQDLEQSPLEYARAHGLALDHTTLNPLKDLEDLAREGPSYVLEDDSSLPQWPFNSTPIPPERLQIGSEAAKFLAEALKTPPNEYYGPDPYRGCELKVEQPVLKTDHESDMRDFTKQVVPDFENETLPQEPADIEADEGLEWPSWCHDLPAKEMSRITSEKLTIPKEAMDYLQEVLSSFDRTDVPDPLDSYEQPTPERSVSPVTPPLLPLSPEYQPFEPSSEVGHMELASEHSTSLIREELEELDHQLLENLGIGPQKSHHEVSSPDRAAACDTIDNIVKLNPVDDTTETPEALRFQLVQRLEGDGSLIDAASSVPSPEEKSVSFKEAMQKIPLGLGEPRPRLANDGTSSDSLERSSGEMLELVAEKAAHKVEYEQRQEADRVCRVPVPAMDFSLPPPPWQAYKSSGPDREASIKGQLNETEKQLMTYGQWPLPPTFERSLRWAPFPSKLAKDPLKESIEDDGTLEQWMSQLDEISAPELPLQDGPFKISAIIGSDNEEIESGDFSDPPSYRSLILKRKLELDPGDEVALTDQRSGDQQVEQNRGDDLQYPASTAPATGAFHGFMNTRKISYKKPRVNVDEPAARHRDAPAQSLFSAKSYNQELGSHLPQRSIPLPEVRQDQSAYQVILSNSLIKRRKLMQQIRTSMPGTTFVERDFTSLARPTINSNDIPTPASCLEADLLLSPGAGVVLTSIQKLNQRVLPGQEPSATTIRSRLLSLAPRYTTLIVLVSQNQPPGTPPVSLSSSDSVTLTSFTAYARSAEFLALETDVQVLYVAGGDFELSRWITALITKYSATGPDTKLLEDETSWEIWLRTAGLNAFAAQAILGQLKAPEGNGGLEYGLARLIRMGKRERVDRSAVLVGGEALVRRVSRVLDAVWNK